MSKSGVWGTPKIDKALQQLRRALIDEAEKGGGRLKMLMIMALNGEDRIAMNFEGCNCEDCAEAVLTYIAQKVFKLETEVVPNGKPVTKPVH